MRRLNAIHIGPTADLFDQLGSEVLSAEATVGLPDCLVELASRNIVVIELLLLNYLIVAVDPLLRRKVWSPIDNIYPPDFHIIFLEVLLKMEA